MTNLKTYPDWTIEDSTCNTTQADLIGTLESDGGIRIDRTEFVASKSDEVPALRVKPVGVLE